MTRKEHITSSQREQHSCSVIHHTLHNQRHHHYRVCPCCDGSFEGSVRSRSNPPPDHLLLHGKSSLPASYILLDCAQPCETEQSQRTQGDRVASPAASHHQHLWANSRLKPSPPGKLSAQNHNERRRQETGDRRCCILRQIPRKLSKKTSQNGVRGTRKIILLSYV